MMDIRCPRCGSEAVPAGRQDARTCYRCPSCDRVWATVAESLAGCDGPGRARRSVRVLVVDDSEDLRGRLGAWLEDEGYAVVTAGSGREALDAAAVYYPDIVMLDLVVPPPDGFQVWQALCSQLPPQGILMTASSSPELARRALDSGAAALLRKPLTRGAVIEAVAAAAVRCRRDPLSRIRWHFGMPPGT
jgi:CheY-like chemotaxis protein